MKATAIGALVGIGLTAAVLGGVGEPALARGDRLATREAVAGRELIALPSSLAEGGQQLAIIDPETKVISVYWIDEKGEISLKSVRRIDWDLKLLHYNGVSPLPNEIRSLVDQGQP